MNSTAIKEPFDREKQFAAKRRAVIRSAGQAFRKRGYHNASMTEIAQTLGLTKAALYYYVKNKEEVLYECHIMAYDAMDAVMNTQAAPGQNALDYLAQLFSDFVTMLTQDGLSLLTDVDSLKGDLKEGVLVRRARIEQRITRIVKSGMVDGSIRQGDPRLTVFFFMGALNWLNAWYDPDGRIDEAAIASHFAAQMRSGISAGSA